MKIRNPRTIRNVARVGAHLIRAWMGTVRFMPRVLGPDVDLRSNRLGGRYIYAFWHETLLLPAFQFRGTNCSVLSSQHADGELIAEICRHLGVGVVRGSTTRGGAEALLGMLRTAAFSHLAITPDGPRGPRRKVQQGVVYLAALTGLPIVPVGFAFNRCWRARSWDRFAVPRPFSKGFGVSGYPITVPLRSVKSREGLEEQRRRVERDLLAVTEVAERWAATGRFDPSAYTIPIPRSAAA